MRERQTRRGLFVRVAEASLDVLAAIGLLGTPLVLAIGLKRQEEQLRVLSESLRYEILVSEQIRTPTILSLAPPLALPGRTVTRTSTFYTDSVPIVESDETQRRYILRNAVRTDIDRASFSYLREHTVTNPVSFSVADRGQQEQP